MKDYKKILEGVVDIINTAEKSDIGFANICTYIGENCPELKESEDERIRKAIHIYLDWLDGRKDYAPKGEYSIRDMIAWIEKQCEQKPVDKVEPKFKVGDFIVNDYCMGKVTELTNDAYLLDTGQGIPFSCEHNAHLWTIQDAKDGDVLVSENSSSFIYNGYLEEKQWPFAYCGTNIGGWFCISGGLLPFTHQKVVPATKKQRDILFQKMKEAGYEWDAEKKELKEIKQKSVEWSEEDEKMFNSALWHIKNSCGNQGKNSGEFEVYNWLKTIKYRYLPQPKQEWSENDEETLKIIDRDLQEFYSRRKAQAGSPLFESQMQNIRWLKSLNNRYTWKPSGGQMEALKEAVDEHFDIDGGVLWHLYQDLKKLREE